MVLDFTDKLSLHSPKLGGYTLLKSDQADPKTHHLQTTYILYIIYKVAEYGIKYMTLVTFSFDRTFSFVSSGSFSTQDHIHSIKL